MHVSFSSLYSSQCMMFVMQVSDLQRKDNVFFLDGPGGTGKTMLENLLLTKVRSEGETATDSTPEFLRFLQCCHMDLLHTCFATILDTKCTVQARLHLQRHHLASLRYCYREVAHHIPNLNCQGMTLLTKAPFAGEEAQLSLARSFPVSMACHVKGKSPCHYHLSCLCLCPCCCPSSPRLLLMCRIKIQSALAELCKLSDLFPWDECPMSNRFLIQALDKTLRDIMCNIPFGGKVILFSGDFRQILPVVQGGMSFLLTSMTPVPFACAGYYPNMLFGPWCHYSSCACSLGMYTCTRTPGQIVNACLKKSPLWRTMRVLRLTINMRVRQAAGESVNMCTHGMLTMIYEAVSLSLPQGV